MITEDLVKKYLEENGKKPIDLTIREPSFKMADNAISVFDNHTKEVFTDKFVKVIDGEMTIDEVTSLIDKELKASAEYKKMVRSIRKSIKENIDFNNSTFDTLQDPFPTETPQFVLDARLQNSLRVTTNTVESAFSKHHRQFKTFADDGLRGVVTGQKSINEATDEFVKRMEREGLSKVTLSDGRQMRADSYIKTYIRSEHNRIDIENMNDLMDAHDLDVFLISTHTHRAPRDGCSPYEHMLVSRSGNTSEILDIDDVPHKVYALSETSYGKADGIRGINCTHSWSPVVPGLFEYGSKPSLKISKRKK